MTVQHIVLMVVLMGGGLLYSLLSIRKMKKGMPDAFRMFFERTGYRYADILERPLEDHVMHGQTLMKSAGSSGYHVHMVRDFFGQQVHSVQDTKITWDGLKQATSTSASWSLPTGDQPRVALQIAERSLVKRQGQETGRLWTQLYPAAISSGDAELDRRFAFFGHEEGTVRAVLHTPGLRDLLLGCAEVDLSVYPDRIVFADPQQTNMTAGMGGYVGSLAMGADMMKRMEATIPIHDRITELLAVTARACA